MISFFLKKKSYTNYTFQLNNLPNYNLLNQLKYTIFTFYFFQLSYSQELIPIKV